MAEEVDQVARVEVDPDPVVLPLRPRLESEELLSKRRESRRPNAFLSA